MAEEYLGWTEELRTGHTVIDTQHRLLFSIFETMEKQIEPAEVGAILNELVHYAETHFRDEELLMAQIGFPGMGDHQRLHHRMLSEVRTLAEEHSRGKLSDWVRTKRYLHDWLRDHILKEDLAYIRFEIDQRKSKDL